ncbi:sulfite exporter TauE/SafE family protein [Streptomyces sp. ADI98-10]|uniref:sulfite exporter TauE/SafE family protein n=1 Tax=Streptomyces sp. ADI98-10 TaxID=1522763 RepID=UPI000F54D338|nr:sulfite exporter TauE/SafE family protein [Streptomyces sp. ADI98-10]RPK88519.1 Sulfite exporter TauE/SafE [Streptomyces sp. ADI98-10]
MDTISLWQLAALAAASTLVGFSKTAVSGANTISLAVFAAVLPARESTGVLLPILIVGDLLAVLVYRRHAHWPTLLRLFPAVAVGVVAGTLFMLWADDAAVRTSIGVILLFMTGVTLWRRRIAEKETETEGGTGRTAARGYGVLGGFTTMVANAGGPVMSLYLLSAGFRKLGFLGTSAWFFLIVNVSKVPFSVGLGLIDARSLLLDACLLLFVLPGAYLGRACVDRINQKVFDRIVIGATVVGGLQLLLI